jgi:hypothetical protein
MQAGVRGAPCLVSQPASWAKPSAVLGKTFMPPLAAGAQEAGVELQLCDVDAAYG